MARSSRLGLILGAYAAMFATSGAPCLAEPQTKPLSTVSADAASAKRQYEDALTQARSAFEEKAKTAKTAYVKKLNASMAAETKRGNLEGAIAIRNEIERLRAPEPASMPAGMTAPSGKWHVRMTTGYECDYIFAADAVQHMPTGERANIKPDGPDFTAHWKNGNTDRYTFVNGRMVIEYWAPQSTALKDVPTAMGTGVKMPDSSKRSAGGNDKPRAQR